MVSTVHSFMQDWKLYLLVVRSFFCKNLNIFYLLSCSAGAALPVFYLILKQTISLQLWQAPYAWFADNDRRQDSYHQIISRLPHRCGNRCLWKIFRIVNQNFCSIKRFAVRNICIFFHLNANVKPYIFPGTGHPIDRCTQLIVDGVARWISDKQKIITETV